jgi:hypothetical protein
MTFNSNALTDDELVALAVDRGRPWPTPLPTVNLEDAKEIQRSALRGLRSLGVRGGLRDGELIPPLDEVAAATASQPGLLLYRGDEAGDPRPGSGLGIAVVALPGSSWLLDEVSASGVHLLRLVDDTNEVIEFLVGALERNASVQGDGLGAAGTTCLRIWESGNSTTLVAGGGPAYVVSPDAKQRQHIPDVRGWVSHATRSTER